MTANPFGARQAGRDIAGRMPVIVPALWNEGVSANSVVVDTPLVSCRKSLVPFASELSHHRPSSGSA